MLLDHPFNSLPCRFFKISAAPVQEFSSVVRHPDFVQKTLHLIPLFSAEMISIIVNQLGIIAVAGLPFIFILQVFTS